MNYDELLDRIDIFPDPFAVCELRGRCDLGLGQDTGATLHYILSGRGEIVLPGRSDIPVQKGSLILIPGMHRHTLRSVGETTHPTPDCRPAELQLRRLLKTQPGTEAKAQVTALCAHVRVGLRGADDIIDLIRTPLSETIHDGQALAPVLRALLQELSAPGLGSRAMIRALLTQCMIELLRRQFKRQGAGVGWMSVLQDPALWASLRVMLDDPGAPHTVESLAALSGMSRSSFAQRFGDVLGHGPIELLRDLRVQRAGVLLRQSDLPIKSIAHQVGFSSRTAFSRTFERSTGVSPTEFRNGCGGSLPDDV